MWISQLLFWRRQMFYKVIIINKPLERFIFPDLQCQGFFSDPTGWEQMKMRSSCFLPFQHTWSLPPLFIPNSPTGCTPWSTAEHTQFLLQLDLANRSGFPLFSAPFQPILCWGWYLLPLFLLYQNNQPIQQIQAILENFTWTKPAKFLKNQENSLKSTKEKLQPGPRMVWAERDLKDLPVCPFYSSHRREFIRDKKNTQLLIMSDGFSFQLRACHLASNPEKADRERNTTVLGWEELFTRIAPSAQKCCIFHLCGEKKKWSEKNPPQNSVTLLEKRAAVFSHRCLEQTKVEADD